jgi:2-polyprenyl-3-methyl-5-hydroxy-6-metoxy-1,4-benzoquinol methylase
MTPQASAEFPSPWRIVDEFLAFERTLALRTALEMELFTRIGSGVDTIEALATQTGASPRGLRIVCDFLTSAGHLAKVEDRYGLPLNSQLYLTGTSPAYLGTAVRFLASDGMLEAFRNLRRAVEGRVPDEQMLLASEAHWVEFAHGMAPLSRMVSQFAAAAIGGRPGEPIQVLDVAAGHGLFGLAVAARNSAAQIFALDAPAVLEVAQQNARHAGTAERYHLLPGDAFAVDFGGPYDLILVANFTHHFDEAANVALFGKCRGALKPSGRLALVDFVANQDCASPLGTAAFALLMLASTPRGAIYTFPEYSRMLEAAGFREPLWLDVGGLPRWVITAAP